MHDKRVNNNVELMKIEYHECECMLLDHSKLTTLNFLLNDPVNPRIQEKKFLENSSSIDEEEELQEVEHYDVENEKEQFIFRVSDNGPGISPEFQQKVFVIFQTLEAKNSYSFIF
jgi:light-regulated signal transduction histidine kinase (bacteriophytochrome)